MKDFGSVLAVEILNHLRVNVAESNNGLKENCCPGNLRSFEPAMENSRLT